MINLVMIFLTGYLTSGFIIRGRISRAIDLLPKPETVRECDMQLAMLEALYPAWLIKGADWIEEWWRR